MHFLYFTIWYIPERLRRFYSNARSFNARINEMKIFTVCSPVLCDCGIISSVSIITACNLCIYTSEEQTLRWSCLFNDNNFTWSRKCSYFMITTRLSKDKSENNFSELHRKVIMGEKAQFQQLDRTQGRETWVYPAQWSENDKII